MNSFTRSAPPAALSLAGQYSPPGSPSSQTSRPSSGDYLGDYSATFPPLGQRKDSSSSSKSSGSTRKPSSPTTNAHSYCGRHSSQWLFSGWSVPGAFRKKN